MPALAAALLIAGSFATPGETPQRPALTRVMADA
jgi:hypothetical protein